MLNPEQIRKHLKDMNLRAVARNTGLSYDTIRRLESVDDVNPTYETIRKVSDYLEEKLRG